MDIYHEHEVDYRRDCTRSDWLAYYHTGQDCIHLTSPRRTIDERTFNLTALHELTHWSRARKRLGPVGGCHCHPDAYEEVVCDMTAAILADHLEIPRTSNRSIKSYIRDEIGRRQMGAEDWMMLCLATHESVEYLLGEAFPLDLVQTFFIELGLLEAADFDAA